MTIFGTSAKYIDALAKLGVKPKDTHRLASVKTMASTGSPLSPESFEYVYANIKQDLLLSSISGGTDIVSCFVLGSPWLPVWRGEIQTRGFGLKVEVYGEEGKPVHRREGRTRVLRRPFRPCRSASGTTRMGRNTSMPISPSSPTCGAMGITWS